jgi:hypothetical protein
MALGLLAACGSVQEPAQLSAVNEEPSEVTATPVEPVAHQVQIEGILGTLSADEVRRGLEPRMRRFATCFSRRYDEIEVLGGELLMGFRVNREGRVLWVRPVRSTVGDRETERCLIDVAAEARFRPPRGGEAEFTYPLMMELPEGVRPPLSWGPERMQASVARFGEGLLEECRPAGEPGGYVVTAYVERPGRILAVGVTTDNPELTDTLDCVADSVRGWETATPGSYPARVQFEVN